MSRSVPALLIAMALLTGAQLQAQHHQMDDNEMSAEVSTASAPPRAARRPKAPEPPPPPEVNRDIRVRTWVSQSAAWVGDRIVFHVDLTCAPNVDVLADDLNQDKLKLTGLEFVGSGEEPSIPGPDGAVTRRFRYELTTYEVDTPTLRIAEFKIRYFVRRPGQRLEDATPAGDLTVPGAVVSQRNTIADETNTVEPRDQREAAMLPAALPLARPVGIALVVVSVVPVGLSVVSLIRRRRPKGVRHSVRAARTHARSAIEELRELDTATEGGRLEAYARLETILRRHVAEATGIPASALTATELEARMQGTKAASAAGTIRELLDECEQARYRPAVHVPPQDRFEAALASTEQVVGRGAR